MYLNDCLKYLEVMQVFADKHNGMYIPVDREMHI